MIYEHHRTRKHGTCTCEVLDFRFVEVDVVETSIGVGVPDGVDVTAGYVAISGRKPGFARCQLRRSFLVWKCGLYMQTHI